MNVITGETGAGKTMVVTGLGLLFGGRADAARVRADPGRAIVEGRVRLSADMAAEVAGAHRRGRRRGRRRRHACCCPARSRSRAGRGRTSAAARCRCRCWPSSASTCSPCTASPTSCGCCARPSSARRSTGSPAPTTRSCCRRCGSGSPSGARSPTTSPTAAATPASATRRPTCCGSVSTRSPGSTRSPARTTMLREEAQRLEHAEGLRAAAQAAHLALGGGAEAGDDTPDADRAARRRPAHAGVAVGASTACSATWPAGSPRRPPGRRHHRRAGRLPGQPRRRPGPAADDLRAAGRAARADPQVRRGRRRRDRLGRPRPDPAGRAGHVRRSAGGARPRSGSGWPTRSPAGGRAVHGPVARRPGGSPTR